MYTKVSRVSVSHFRLEILMEKKKIGLPLFIFVVIQEIQFQ